MAQSPIKFLQATSCFLLNLPLAGRDPMSCMDSCWTGSGTWWPGSQLLLDLCKVSTTSWVWSDRPIWTCTPSREDLMHWLYGLRAYQPEHQYKVSICFVYIYRHILSVLTVFLNFICNLNLDVNFQEFASRGVTLKSGLA